MEEEFDALVERQPESRMAMVWTAFGKDLRRSAALRDDIATLGMQVRDPSIVIPLSHTHTHNLREHLGGAGWAARVGRFGC